MTSPELPEPSSEASPTRPTPVSAPPRSQAEQSASARARRRSCSGTGVGCRFRSWRSRSSRRRMPTGYNWLVGFVLIVIGESIRLAGVAVAGTVTRRRSRDVQRLVNLRGVFGWVRNPLLYRKFSHLDGFRGDLRRAVVPAGWRFTVIFAIEYSLIVAFKRRGCSSPSSAPIISTYKEGDAALDSAPSRATGKTVSTTGSKRGGARSARSCSTGR